MKTDADNKRPPNNGPQKKYSKRGFEVIGPAREPATVTASVGKLGKKLKECDPWQMELQGDDIKVGKDGTLGFYTCVCATNKLTDCIVAVCKPCHADLMTEHKLTKTPRLKKDYAFPGCENHSYKELELKNDAHGAYWCDKNRK